MGVGFAQAQAIAKPWGVSARHFGMETGGSFGHIGEIRYARPDGADGALSLRLIMTAEPLAVQVQPPGGPGGGWAAYVIDASPDARIAHGLRKRATAEELHAAVDSRVLPRHLRWITVRPGDAVMVPAGTLHSVGPGLVLAEIRRTARPPLRLYDYHRDRRLDVDAALAVADLGPGPDLPNPHRLDDWRLVLIETPGLILERIDLPGHTAWHMNLQDETWILGLSGAGRLAGRPLAPYDAVHGVSGRIPFETGPSGASLLVAYGFERARRLLVRPALPSV